MNSLNRKKTAEAACRIRTAPRSFGGVVSISRGGLPPRGRLALLLLATLALFNCDALFDIAPPKIEIIEPQEGISYFVTLPVYLQVTDNNKVEKVEVFLDDASVHQFTKEPYKTEIDLGGISADVFVVVAHDQAGNWSDSELRANFIEEKVSKPDTPTGSDDGYINWDYTYATDGSTSNTKHSIEYRFDWGGGSYSNWSSSTSASHSWSIAGNHIVKAQARCANHTGVVSSWSNSNIVTITVWSPVLAGSYDTPGDAVGVFVSGSYAYVADGNSGLQVIDVSNPSSPTLAGSYDTQGHFWGLFVSGGYAYVANGSSDLQVINVSIPTAPTLAGSYDTPGIAWGGVFVTDDYAYVADGSSGLQIINVSNPAAPTLAGSYDTPGNAWRVFVSGSYAYVADDHGGLQIIDVSNPASPALAGTYDTPGNALDVFVSGSFAYVADWADCLQIINVSNPASPILAGTYNTPQYSYSRGVFVSGSYAYVADAYSGLQIVDISNPASPALAGTYDTPGDGKDVFVSGSYVYVANEEAGLLIFDVSGLP